MAADRFTRGLDGWEPDEEDDDRSDCAYFGRYYRQPGHDPKAICSYSCVDEPACITEEPTDGWPQAAVNWPSSPPKATTAPT